MRHFIIILTTAFLFASTTSVAVEVTGLYVAEQRVETQDPAALDAVSAAALEAILLKVVGDRAQLASLSFDDIEKVAPALIEQHQYFNANAANAVHDNTAPEQLAVRLKFDEMKVNQQLSDWGLPSWGKTRPAVLLLLIRDKAGHREILVDDTLVSVALDEAASRGVPILMPLMDLADYQGLNMAALWAGDFAATAPFAARYQSPLLVTARMASQGNGQWRIQWQYNLEGKVNHWQSAGAAAEAVQLGMADLADNLARQFSHTKTAASQPFILEVEGVVGFAAHQQVTAFLSDLQHVEQVQQHALIEGVLTVSLHYFGDEQALRSVISGGELLVSLQDIVGVDRLYYRVRP